MTDEELLRKVIAEVGPPKTKDGDVDRFFSTAHDDLDLIERFVEVPAHRTRLVVDVGCGFGRLACATVSRKWHYVGFDVSEKRLAYARRLFAWYAGTADFFHVPVHNQKYNREGGPASVFKMDLADDQAPAATAISLFTHMPAVADVRHYLREICRVLTHRGVLVSTWLTSPPLAGLVSDTRRAIYTHAEIEALFRERDMECVFSEGAGTEDSHLRLVTRKL